MVRILHVFNKMDVGGAETFIMNIYRAVDRNRYQFDFLVHTQEKGFFDEEIKKLGGRIFVINRPSIFGLLVYKSQLTVFFNSHPEISIVHGHMGSLAAIYLFCAKKKGKFTIAHSHSTYIKHHNFLHKMATFPTRFIADYFIGCSYAALYSRYGRNILKHRKGCFLPNGIDARKFGFSLKQRQIVREELRAQDDSVVIAFVGRMVEDKNPKFALRVLEELKKKNHGKDFKLCFVGNGRLAEDIKNEAASRFSLNSVRFLGIRSDVSRLLNGFDLVVMPSLREGFPMTLIEAQCNGLICFVSDRVTREVALTDLIYFLPIDSPESWSRAILSAGSDVRKTHEDVIIQRGFDVSSTLRELLSIYDTYGKKNNND